MLLSMFTPVLLKVDGEGLRVAVQAQCLAGNFCSLLRRQEQREVCDIPGINENPHGRLHQVIPAYLLHALALGNGTGSVWYSRQRNLSRQHGW